MGANTLSRVHTRARAPRCCRIIVCSVHTILRRGVARCGSRWIMHHPPGIHLRLIPSLDTLLRPFSRATVQHLSRGINPACRLENEGDRRQMSREPDPTISWLHGTYIVSSIDITSLLDSSCHGWRRFKGRRSTTSISFLSLTIEFSLPVEGREG